MNTSNGFPDIDSYDSNFNNPTLSSPNSPFELQFAATRESLLDIEDYRHFLENAISRFRRSRSYKNYKAYLMELGLDHCQFHGNINSEMATIEMHHTIITIFDVALIITEHMLNTQGFLTTFDLVTLLKTEHKANRIPITMLSLTPHQLYHNTDDFYIHPSMVFGDWVSLLERYKYGITRDVAFKIYYYCKRAIEEDGSNDARYLDLRDNILDWSDKIYANV